AMEDPFARGVCDAVVITLSTGYAVGCLSALLLNTILPADDEEEITEAEGHDLLHKATKSVDDAESAEPSSDESEELAAVEPQEGYYTYEEFSA
ncbi:expressed unknown protein (Partial), partial [Seminavis robusta]